MHGVKQPRNPWSDGPEYITQCAIEPGRNFTYEVIFSDEEGTLWWHAHSDWARNSIHGASSYILHLELLIHFLCPMTKKLSYLVRSWYKGDLNLLLMEDIILGGPLPDSDAHLINGQPGDFCNCSKESTNRWMIDYGKTYMLHIISAMMNADVFFAIADHNLTIVGMDGNYLKPTVASYVVISPGQTMSVLLRANQPLGQYYMATREYDSSVPSNTDYDKTNATAILEYIGNYTFPSDPIFPSTNLPSFEDFIAADNFLSRLRSLASHDHPSDVPKKHYNPLAASMNNITFVNPNTDILSAYYWNLSGVYTTDFPNQPFSYYNFTDEDLTINTASMQGTKVKMLNYNETVEIIFQGTNIPNTSETHPMHLHGYNFYVVGSGYGNFDPEIDPKGYNLVDPLHVNTIAIPRNGWDKIINPMFGTTTLP
ncbi:unnamed protein product [Camellia sinensis]